MAELVVAIVCILILVSGLLQLILLGTADTNTLVEATARASNKATASLLLAETPSNIRDWEAGRDGMRHTKDDRSRPGGWGAARRQIAEATAPNGDWSAVDQARFDNIARFHHGTLPSATMGFVSGSAEEDVEALPAAMAFFGLRNPTRVRNEVWMTATGSLY